jgi:tetraacyldisaccharide 4'-kinase
MRGEIHSPADRLAAGGLRVLSGVYGGLLRAHHAGYRWGWAKRTRLPALVVSVGNLTVGGTGKTTTCLSVAEWFSQQGKRVAFLSRGYRGQGERSALVVSEGAGPIVEARAAGDEPYLVARALPQVCVLVGKDRRRTGRLAVERYGAEVIVLDDGFQYQRLERDLDIVLVDALLPFGYDWLVPRGLLREPVAHLSRAQAVWLTHCDLVRGEDLAQIRARVAEVAPQARVWEARHAPVALREVATGARHSPGKLRGRRVLALSGLGNPLAFERSLERLGAEVVAHARFPDHHRYRAEEVRAALEAEGEAAWVVTTEKDAVRLPREALVKPTWVLEIALAGRAEASTAAEELRCLLTAARKM